MFLESRTIDIRASSSRGIVVPGRFGGFLGCIDRLAEGRIMPSRIGVDECSKRIDKRARWWTSACVCGSGLSSGSDFQLMWSEGRLRNKRTFVQDDQRVSNSSRPNGACCFRSIFTVRFCQTTKTTDKAREKDSNKSNQRY